MSNGKALWIGLSAFVALGVGLGATSCSTACSPGATQTCACSGGTTGVQTCSDDGNSWKPCDCGGGGSGGQGGSGGMMASSSGSASSSGAIIQCGDGNCDPSENCMNCAADCACGGVDVCDNGQCKTPCGGINCPECNKCEGSQCAPDPTKDGTPCSGGTCQGGTCVCQPDCAMKCGGAPNGCGGTCNSPCATGCCDGMACTDGNSDSACGSNGQMCATCSNPKHCSGGACICNSDCTGKCGGAPDGCNGTCNGSCASGTQYCSNQACVTCQYQASLPTADYTSGGGQPICIQQATIDASGNMAITAAKCDSTTFGAGEYYVFVFDPNDGIPSNHCQPFNAQKAHVSLTGSSTPVLAFPVFPTSLTCGGPEKGFCVTKAGSNAVTTWFGSHNMIRASDK